MAPSRIVITRIATSTPEAIISIAARSTFEGQKAAQPLVRKLLGAHRMKALTSITCLVALCFTVACDNGSGTNNNAGGDGGGGPPPGGDGGGGGLTGPTIGTPVLLTVDPTGWVDKGGNSVGIQGAWYAYDDCANSPGACTLNHTPPSGSFENTGGKMCTKGTTVAVKAEADFSKQWGAGIALDLNNSGGANGQKMPFDAQAANVIGFFMNITGTAPGLRINITSVPTGDDSHFITAKTPGENTVELSKVNQGSWVTAKTPLDTTQLLAIQFQIPTVMNKAVDFDFCVEGLSALTP